MYVIIEPEYEDLTLDIYSEGSILGSEKDWFHGEVTIIEAEQILAASNGDCFLIRKTRGALFMSLMHEGQIHHIKIKYGPGWYELEGGSAKYCFPDLEDLVTYYSRETISNNLNIKLGRVCTGILNGYIKIFGDT